MRATILIFLTLTFFHFTLEAQDLNGPFVIGLDCPGADRFISTARRDANLKNESIVSRFPVLYEEISFHLERIKNRNNSHFRAMQYLINGWEKNFEMKAGIHFDPAALGLPLTDQNCRVVPIVVQVRSPIAPPTYIVSRDDWDRLAPIDQLIGILNVQSHFKWSTLVINQDAIDFLLSDTSFALSLRDYYKFQIKRLSSYRIAYDGSDYSSCDFVDADFPYACRMTDDHTFNSALNNTLAANREIYFGPTGRITSAWVYLSKAVPRNLRDPLDMVPCGSTTTGIMRVFYTGDGKLIYCKNTFLQPSDGLRVEQGVGYLQNSSTVLFGSTNAAKWFDFFYRKEFKNLPGYQVAETDELCRTFDTPTVLELYSNGDFKSGLMKSTQDSKIAYIEVNNNNKITKKIPYDCGGKSQTPFAFDIINETKEVVSYGFKEHSNSFVIDLQVLYQSKPNCLSVEKDKNGHVKQYSISPNCFIYAKVLGVGNWK